MFAVGDWVSLAGEPDPVQILAIYQPEGQPLPIYRVTRAQPPSGQWRRGGPRSKWLPDLWVAGDELTPLLAGPSRKED